ncbi:MmgE/PrpD family protein [Rhodalgimonas zhirmunskyi]|uniref:MmgE/PrpD family protein n=1 Tax=Rhodalgimonas zhirmunskyi TaxID=2964767 RepID=A0AAJ1U865_9RHOB|nr:MmgE/PrpD family protein [Rhodoalgimonas zhirmunskyi]MDQ2095395.1 MmgE/PrpD family protein [Rhodoalgimonas zhirmunskyi]
MPDTMSFLHDLGWSDLPPLAQIRVKMSLLDLIAIAAGAQDTQLTRIIADHAVAQFGGPHPMVFDARTASHAGVALALGMRIDSLDGHDGFNPSKGHIGCSLFPAALTLAQVRGASGAEFLATLAMGYEVGARAAIAQHASAPDYHTSGSWGAVAAAAASARQLQLSGAQTRHALGIAEYHGPRSQMMRCIDHPTMVKDGSGWGAMTGVSAAFLAQAGFTGAPALIVEDAPDVWADLGQRWYVTEQYFKPYPVCRWAQAPIEAALALRRAHGFAPGDIASVEIESFHACIRLATANPEATDEAQYSTSFPVALALLHGDIRPEHLSDAAITDPAAQHLSGLISMREHDHANAAFPLTRLARVTITLFSGQRLTSDWHEPRWDYTAPPSPDEISAKFRAYAGPVLGPARTRAIKDCVDDLEHRDLAELGALLFAPV